MPDPKHPTNPDWVMKDPEIDPPPVGESLLILNPGGVLHISSWYKGAMAYAKKPVVPESVKARTRIKL